MFLLIYSNTTNIKLKCLSTNLFIIFLKSCLSLAEVTIDKLYKFKNISYFGTNNSQDVTFYICSENTF